MPSLNFKGLSDKEVEANRIEFGSNTLELETQNKLWRIVKNILLEPMFIILVFIALLYFIVGQFNEGLVMIVAVVLVSGISVYQETKSQNAVEALKKLSNPTSKVIRNGIVSEILYASIVLHDLIIVEDGNIIPADAKILESHDFTVNESILTGESMPVAKDTQKSENIIFQGTMVMTGSCIAEVTAIGKATALGKIGLSLNEIETSQTPLQEQIKSFVFTMIKIGVVVFILVCGFNYYLSKNILSALLDGLTLAMAIIPEEIPVAFSTFMALGAYHLYKKKVIAKTPYTVETLGAATVICTDKTGTITENSMQLASIFDAINNKIFDFRTEPLNFNPVLEYAMWASEINPFDNMEKSIQNAYASVATKDERENYSMVHEYPLSGKPPIMTHVFSDNKSKHIIASKGSVEGILNQCKLAFNQKMDIQKIAKLFAQKGFRVLGVAKSNHELAGLPVSQLEFEFEFVGLIAFYDPPRKNMLNTIQQFYNAGIDVKMITGDFPETAMAIANQINLKGSSVLTGNEVLAMDEAQLRENVSKTNIYARMFPEAKLKVVEALKANGEIVAMTGDGVNDGPALKAAHIGIAMGLRGSEIAKKASALILTDDDFSHMLDAIKLGRRIYENLKKAIRYIISIHIPIILIVTIPLLLFWKFTGFFSPIHVIFLELIMGPTCSIIFENEPIESNSMFNPPRKMTKSFFSFSELALSIFQGLAITAGCLCLGYFYMLNNNTIDEVRTLIYSTLIFSNLFLTLVNRSFYYSIFTTIRYKNNLIPIILTLSLVVLLFSIYFPPVRNLFQFAEVGLKDLLISVFIAFISVLWVEIYKFYKRKKGKSIDE